jgi:hypothetical protein
MFLILFYITCHDVIVCLETKIYFHFRFEFLFCTWIFYFFRYSIPYFCSRIFYWKFSIICSIAFFMDQICTSCIMLVNFAIQSEIVHKKHSLFSCTIFNSFVFRKSGADFAMFLSAQLMPFISRILFSRCMSATADLCLYFDNHFA